jgi:hypothetical protein
MYTYVFVMSQTFSFVYLPRFRYNESASNRYELLMKYDCSKQFYSMPVEFCSSHCIYFIALIV